ncbi:DinB family protein [Dactylosporangium sp. NPDC051484]|uniref:DinB family protein n=1 Tax=Dactylosporangium sp. NPDC051484 TaxID=3154942 RepID=UPI00344CE87F
MLKTVLKEALHTGRENLLWKLDGLSEYDIRRPMVPTGTNLLGLVKHLTGVEAGYFGATFGRPFPEPLPWLADDAEDDADMWATAEESRADVIDRYRRVWAHADATIDTLDLDAPGRVPWWQPERADVTLHLVLVRVIGDTDRHTGQADIIRELIDGAAGWRPTQSNLPDTDDAARAAHLERLERIARAA